MLKVGLLGALPFMAALAPPPQEPAPHGPAVFHSGTRLVEVEVVVRDKNGPVKGLTKDDFTLLDQGKAQPIAIFRSASTGDSKASALPAGSVSNRQDGRGQAVTGATVVLLDQLNTKIDYKSNERGQIVKLLRSLTGADRIALYSLGRSLHVVQDFTDDPHKLIDAVAKLDQGLDLLPNWLGDDRGGVMLDFPDPDDPKLPPLMKNAIHYTSANQVQQNNAIYDEITVDALRRVIQHLSGVPGRKNLVWIKELAQVPPAVMAMAQRANVAIYPVILSPRTVGDFAFRHAVEDFAAATGGAGFLDAGDLTLAVHTAEEDGNNIYTLGYYPAEEMLDGKYHRVSVKVTNKALEVRYRPGYLATKVDLPTPSPLLEDLFEDPLEATRIGLTAQATPEPEHAGLYQLRLTVDLHDVHLERKASDHSTGAFDVSLLFPSSKSIKTVTIPVDLTDAQLAQALEAGYIETVKGVEAQAGQIRVVVRDRATGIAGSLNVPLAKQ